MSCAKVFSVGLQEKWPWPAVIIIGFGFVGIQVVAIPTITITYAIDCYRPISGEIMAIATVCKNTFGVSRFHFRKSSYNLLIQCAYKTCRSLG